MSDTAVDAVFLSFQEALAGRYSLERELGRGGMGIVYLAREVRLDRPVAIKLLPPELAANDKLRERFLREARTAARLSHPYIVPIHSVDEVGAFVFYVMTYVDGETVLDRVRRDGAMRPADVSRVLREVAWALAYAHAQGVVHRDIKPANIMLERGTERAMVMDFGIARLTNTAGETLVGEVMGTPEYMSPEQACGEAVDGRSDLYSLGVVGYFMLSGTLPFTGDARALLARQVTQPAAPVATVARAAPRALSAAIDRCLAKAPDQRFPTGEALADALAQNLEKRADVPVPLRVFLDRRRNALMVIPVAMGLPLVAGIVARLAVGSEATATATALAAGALILSAPIAILVYRLRRLMRFGYGTEDVAGAMRTLHERRREEFLYEFGVHTSTREKVLRVISVGGFALAAVGAVKLIAPWTISAVPVDAAAATTVLSGYVGLVATVIRRRWQSLREGREPRLARFWQGRIGRLLGRLAGFRLARPVIAADRPTELGIAMSAEALYAQLPKPQRKLLGDVPAVLHGLQAHARAMRARMEDLDRSLVQAQGASRHAAHEHQERLVADLRAARGAVEQRLSDVVTALETLRLDLLRLQAGAGTAESITQDLSSARALSEDVDRLVEGQREVEAALKLPPATAM